MLISMLFINIRLQSKTILRRVDWWAPQAYCSLRHRLNQLNSSKRAWRWAPLSSNGWHRRTIPRVLRTTTFDREKKRRCNNKLQIGLQMWIAVKKSKMREIIIKLTVTVSVFNSLNYLTSTAELIIMIHNLATTSLKSCKVIAGGRANPFLNKPAIPQG